jgi:endonuclease YncB( thermonuclease family)
MAPEPRVVRDTYVRSVDVVRVLDGDTFICDVQLGFYVSARMSCRLAGINTPERVEPGWAEAKAALAEILGRGKVTVESVRADKYAGRFTAEVVVTGPPDADHIAQAWHVNGWLVEQGYAVAWAGKGPRPSVPWPPTNSPVSL